MVVVIDRDGLTRVGSSREFEGYEHGDVATSFILVNSDPGSGPRLHGIRMPKFLCCSKERRRLP